MFQGSFLFSIIVLALAAHAEPIYRRVDTPLITLKTAKRVNSTGAFSLLARDQARARFLRAKGENPSKFKSAGVVSSIPATNQAVDYTVEVRWCTLVTVRILIQIS